MCVSFFERCTLGTTNTNTRAHIDIVKESRSSSNRAVKSKDTVQRTQWLTMYSTFAQQCLPVANGNVFTEAKRWWWWWWRREENERKEEIVEWKSEKKHIFIACIRAVTFSEHKRNKQQQPPKLTFYVISFWMMVFFQCEMKKQKKNCVLYSFFFRYVDDFAQYDFALISDFS